VGRTRARHVPGSFCARGEGLAADRWGEAGAGLQRLAANKGLEGLAP